jgi:hypothetical protein
MGNIWGIKNNHPDCSYSGRSAVLPRRRCLRPYPAVQSGAQPGTVRPEPNAVRDGSNSVGGMGPDLNRLPHDFRVEIIDEGKESRRKHLFRMIITPLKTVK